MVPFIILTNCPIGQNARINLLFEVMSSCQLNGEVQNGDSGDGHKSRPNGWVAVVAFGDEIAGADIEKKSGKYSQN